MDYILKEMSMGLRHRSSAGTGGFTLLEVLVALAILTVTLTGIYRLQSQTLMMSSKARFYSLAPMLAQSRLAEMQREGFDDVSAGSGDFGQDYPSYKYSVEIEALDSDLTKEGKYQLVRVDLTISNDDEESYELRTYRFFSQ